MAKIALKTESTTPANPAVGYAYLYVKPDGKVYKKTDDGVESEVGSAATESLSSFLLMGA